MDFSAPQPIWKTILIDSIFYPDEASIIKAIPLSIRRPEDSLIWMRNQSGSFFVRSAYFLQIDVAKQSKSNLASTSNSTSLHSFWNGIWATMVPPKIKTFIWRACIDSLPLHTKLFDMKISNLFSYGFCSEEAETGTHLFWECSFTQAVWLQAPFWNDFCLPNHISFIDTLDAAIKKLSSADFDTICITCWMI